MPYVPKDIKSSYRVQNLGELGATRLVFKNGATVIIKPLPVGSEASYVNVEGYSINERNIDQLSLVEDARIYIGPASIDARSLNNLNVKIICPLLPQLRRIE